MKTEGTLFVSVSKVTNFSPQKRIAQIFWSRKKHIHTARNDAPRAITGQIDGRRVPTKYLPPPPLGSASDDDDFTSKRGKMLNKRAAFNRAKDPGGVARAIIHDDDVLPEQPRRVENVEKHASFMSKTLFVELGVGSDQHGQDGTKAAVRACKDAISFNSLPAIADLIPGGYGGMKLHVLIAAPIDEYPVDVDEVKKVFPYGNVNVELVRGGMVAASGIAIEAMGDRFDGGKRTMILSS